MKLYILRPHRNLPDNDDPWIPWYDKPFGYIVRAESEIEARELCAKNSDDSSSLDGDVWRNHHYVECRELTSNGEAGIIIRDFHAA